MPSHLQKLFLENGKIILANKIAPFLLVQIFSSLKICS